VSPEKLGNASVTIIGTGAIGSFTALALSKMGIKTLTLWDADEVAEHNIANQYFPPEAIGKPKVEATSAECQRHSPEPIDLQLKPEMYTGQPIETMLVIALTDNIEGRVAAFKAAKESFSTDFFIDGRMGGEILRILALPPKSTILSEKYEKDYLEGVVNQEEPCTARSIVYNVLMASSLISSHVKKFVNGEKIPFLYAFDFKSLTQVKSKV